MEEHYQEGDNQGIRRWITKLKIKFDSEPKDGIEKKIEINQNVEGVKGIQQKKRESLKETSQEADHYEQQENEHEVHIKEQITKQDKEQDIHEEKVMEKPKIKIKENLINIQLKH